MITTELTGVVLNWAVTGCELKRQQDRGERVKEWVLALHKEGEYVHPYIEDWALMGPVIERESINLISTPNPYFWWAVTSGTTPAAASEGCSPLIAACRCYVASVLGREIEVPDCLIPPLGKA